MAVVRRKLMTDRPDVQKPINLTQYVIGRYMCPYIKVV